jgi:hypothetical protein
VAGGSGGAIWTGGSGTPDLRIADSVFSDDHAGRGNDTLAEPGGTLHSGGVGGDGGAVAVTAGTATITGSAFLRDRAGDGGDGATDAPGGFLGGRGGAGGALAVAGAAVSVTDATFQGDRAGDAGAIAKYSFGHAPGGDGGGAALLAGSLDVSFSTFSGDAVGVDAAGLPGVGRDLLGGRSGGSLFADDGACSGVSATALLNVVRPGDTSCPGPRLSGDARLGVPAGNGGPTPTMLPGAGSIAIDAIVGVPCPATDARGLIRPRFAGCDAGAVELQPGSPAAPGGGGGGAVVPGTRSIGGLALGKSVFRARGRGAGTTVTYRLGLAGRVVLTVRKAAPGRRAGLRCVAPTRRLKAARRCARRVTLRGSIVRRGVAGTNRLRFTGVVGGHRLAPGAYTLVLALPRTPDARAVSVSRGFRILA